MNSKKSTEIKVGVVSLLGIIILVLGIGLGKDINLSSKTYNIDMRFPHSGSIQPTSPVLVNGVKRGMVNSIRNENGHVIVNAEIDNIADLKSDAVARILIMEITGGKKIDIHPGSSNENFDLNQVMTGETPPDIGEIIAILGSISGEVVSLVRKLDTLAEFANNAIKDTVLKNKFSNIIDNTEDISGDIASILNRNKTNINQSISDLKDFINDAKTFLKENEDKLNNIVSSAEPAMANLNTITEDAKTTISKANSLLDNLNKISNELQNNKGFASRLIYDEQFARQLDSTLIKVQELFKKIGEHGVNVNVELGHEPD